MVEASFMATALAFAYLWQRIFFVKFYLLLSIFQPVLHLPQLGLSRVSTFSYPLSALALWTLLETFC